jgi:cyclohexanone monooxygenase
MTQSGFDPDALRARYLAERDKRLRSDGNDQYLQVSGHFAHLAADPNITEPLRRPPMRAEVEVLVVGAGWGGLLAAVELAKAGLGDGVRLLDQAADVGGTWYWNRYPGVQCDIESYIYLPLLEEMGYVPRHKYAYGSEIWAYMQAIAQRYDLYRHALFQTGVRSQVWDDDAGCWRVGTTHGDELSVRHVILSTGILNRPKLPAIGGLEGFTGHCFHTSRWDYAYTGGSPDGGLTGLTDKVVGIVGTGASAVQAVPHLAAHAKQLYVFQRTPSSIDVRGNHPTDPAWAAALQPGWQQSRIDNFNTIVDGGQADVDLVDDGWTAAMRTLRLTPDKLASKNLAEITAAMELADFAQMERIRARVDALVTDPGTAAALKPYYRQFCKRPCFHDEYLPAFNRPNVTLVDTDGRGIDGVEGRTVRVGERRYELDCLILASGFEVGTDFGRRSGFETVGRGGRALDEHWQPRIRTLQGFWSEGFPNCHLMGMIQQGLSVNFSLALHQQARHIAYVIATARDRGAAVVEATAEGEETWLAQMRAVARDRRDFQDTCTPGYYNNEGQTGRGRGFTDNLFGGTSAQFYGLLRDWRDAGDLAGLTLR